MIKFCNIQVEKSIKLEEMFILIKLLKHISYGEPSKQTLLLTETHEKELVFKDSEVDQVKSAEAPCMLKVAEPDYFVNHVTKLASYSSRYFLQIFPASFSLAMKVFLCCIRWTQPMYIWRKQRRILKIVMQDIHQCFTRQQQT